MVVPALACAIDLLILRRSIRQTAKWTALWWPIAITSMVIARIAQPVFVNTSAPLWLRPFVAMDALAFYFYKIVWPWTLCLDYGRTPTVAQDHGWLYLTWIVPLAIAAVLFWRPRRELLAGAMLLAICVAPVLGLTPFLFQFYSTVSDHYVYLAMIGPALALAWFLTRFPARAPIAIAVLALLAVRSFAQSAYWEDDQAVFDHTMAANPNSFLACNNLGGAFCHAADVEEGAADIADRVGDHATAAAYRAQAKENYLRAKDLYERSIQTRMAANRGQDDYSTAHGNLGKIHTLLDEPAQALAHRLKAIEIVKTFPPAVQKDLPFLYCLAGENLLSLHKPREALRYFDESLRLDPRSKVAHSGRDKAIGAMAVMPMD